MTVTVTLAFSDAATAVQALSRMLTAYPDVERVTATEVRERMAEPLGAAGIDPRPVAAAPDNAQMELPPPAAEATPPKKRVGRPKKTETAQEPTAPTAPAPAVATATYPTVEQVIAKGREVYEKLGPQKGLVQCNALLARYGATRFSEILMARSPEFMKDADDCIGGKDFTAVVD